MYINQPINHFPYNKPNLKIQLNKINFNGVEQAPRKQGKILGMTFPKQDTNLGLEPSILTVLPEGENVEYILDQKVDKYPDEKVDLYLCSVYITGMEEFIEWAKKHPKSKIVVGGYEPTINPQDFTAYADKIITGPCDSFWETMSQKGQVVKGLTLNKKIPRYDLYDVRLNQQIIPDKKPNDVVPLLFQEVCGD